MIKSIQRKQTIVTVPSIKVFIEEIRERLTSKHRERMKEENAREIDEKRTTEGGGEEERKERLIRSIEIQRDLKYSDKTKRRVLINRPISSLPLIEKERERPQAPSTSRCNRQTVTPFSGE